MTIDRRARGGPAPGHRSPDAGICRHRRARRAAAALDRPGARRAGGPFRPADGAAGLQPLRARRGRQRSQLADEPDDGPRGGAPAGAARPVLPAQLRVARAAACAAAAGRRRAPAAPADGRIRAHAAGGDPEAAAGPGCHRRVRAHRVRSQGRGGGCLRRAEHFCAGAQFRTRARPGASGVHAARRRGRTPDRRRGDGAEPRAARRARRRRGRAARADQPLPGGRACPRPGDEGGAGGLAAAARQAAARSWTAGRARPPAQADQGLGQARALSRRGAAGGAGQPGAVPARRRERRTARRGDARAGRRDCASTSWSTTTGARAHP